jgi:hypothetical protein
MDTNYRKKNGTTDCTDDTNGEARAAARWNATSGRVDKRGAASPPDILRLRDLIAIAFRHGKSSDVWGARPPRALAGASSRPRTFSNVPHGLAKPISIGAPGFSVLTITALSGRTSRSLYLISSIGFRENS